MLKINKNKIFKILLLLLFLFANKIEAASLTASTSSSKVSVGDIFSLNILVDTESKFINNSEAVINFPINFLEVISISKSSSIFSLWVDEPKYSNVNGTISFNGGVPNPGFNGKGKIISVTFKAKKSGEASFIINDASVRENDGLGTDILSKKISGYIQINELINTTPKEDLKTKLIYPLKPVIFSDSHREEDRWYSNNNVSFAWKVPSGVDSIQSSLTKNKPGIPNIAYDNSVTQKTLSNLNDGVYYFNLRYKNSSGFGPTTSYKINIDKTSPEKIDILIKKNDLNNYLKIIAKDITSGIDHYIIKIDSDYVLEIKPENIVNGEYLLPFLNEGNHLLRVVAYDKSLNYTESDTISFVADKIRIPSIELEKYEIPYGESVSIKGKTNYPNKDIFVYLSKDNKIIKKYNQKTLEDGSYNIKTDAIKEVGLLSFWAELVISDYIKSDLSEKVFLQVDEIEAIKFTLSLVYPIISIIIISCLILILLFILYLGWHKFFDLRKTINKNLSDTAIDIHKASILLKEELNKQLVSLEKVKVDRRLNKKERIIFNEIKKNIDDLDDFIENKLKKMM